MSLGDFGLFLLMLLCKGGHRTREDSFAIASTFDQLVDPPFALHQHARASKIANHLERSIYVQGACGVSGRVAVCGCESIHGHGAEKNNNDHRLQTLTWGGGRVHSDLPSLWEGSLANGMLAAEEHIYTCVHTRAFTHMRTQRARNEATTATQ
jgi:hypothetical protein